MTHSDGLGRQDVARCWAGFASFGAGLVHVAVVREHFSEYWLFGVFFTVLGLAQIAWALGAFARPTVPLPRLTGIITLGVIALWLVARTTGLPIGPEPWTAEAFGRADVLCAVLEVALLLCLVVATRPAPQPTVDRRASAGAPARFVALMMVGAFAVAGLATPAMAATESGEHAHGHFGAVEHGDHTP
jgi:hypothetical protein